MDINNCAEIPRELKTMAWAISNNDKNELVVDDVEALAKYLLGLGFEPGIYTLESVNTGSRAFLVLRGNDPRVLGLVYDPPYLSKCFKMPYRGALAA